MYRIKHEALISTNDVLQLKKHSDRFLMITPIERLGSSAVSQTKRIRKWHELETTIVFEACGFVYYPCMAKRH